MSLIDDLAKKYKLKDPSDYKKAEDELKNLYDAKERAITPNPTPTVTTTPTVSNPSTGNTTLSYPLSGASGTYNQSVAKRYSTHPQHGSGIWGKAEVSGGQVNVTLPSTDAARNKDRIGQLVSDVVQEANAQWQIEENKRVSKELDRIRKERALLVKDLEVRSKI